MQKHAEKNFIRKFHHKKIDSCASHSSIKVNKSFKISDDLTFFMKGKIKKNVTQFLKNVKMK